MTYIEGALSDGEKIVYQAHFHILLYVLAWFLIIGCLLFAGAAFIFFSAPVTWIAVGACLVGIGFIAYWMLPIWTTEIGVTSDRLIIKRGWLSRSVNELQLESVEKVNSEQDVLGRILNYGSIIVYGKGTEALRLPAIAAPREFVKELENASNYWRAEASETDPATALDDAKAPDHA
ncbi:MAG: PH domain-containing protein [Dichotomicrobium sp.]